MNRRDFLKSFSLITATSSILSAQPANEYVLNNTTNQYYINCYIQNQKFWPLEEYKDGSFRNGKLYFESFQESVDFIHKHSLVTPFYNEALYEVFHETSRDPMIAPKQIFTYWVKLKEGDVPDTITWIRPDYIDHTADGALIEHGK